MHCKTCNYALWNLKTRICPECGSAFKPSDFEFAPNTVQFCCPECDQPYYGTSQQGHLVPREFDCVSCGRHIHIDETVLRPAAGVSEDRTQADRVSWLERRDRGWLRCWFKTIGQTISQPMRLAAAAREKRRPGEAFLFALVSLSAYIISGVFGAGALISIPLAISGDAEVALWVVLGTGITSIAMIVTVLLGLALWALSAHLMLRITGGTEKTIGRTFEAVSYSAGVMFALAVPGVGPYCGIYFAPIWWIVVACLMLWKLHEVHGGRAALAALTFPVLTFVLFFGSYFGFIIYAMSTTSGMSTTTSGFATPKVQAQQAANFIISHAQANNGQGPAHALQLLSSTGMGTNHFIAWSTATQWTDVAIGSATLDDYDTLSISGRQAMEQAAVRQQPADVVAHRVGDLVFTYHGFDLSNPPDPGLWLVVVCDDPDAMAAAGTGPTIDPVPIGLAGGGINSVWRSNFQPRLQKQNALRAQFNLPPLPNPLTLSQDRPAAAGDPSEEGP